MFRDMTKRGANGYCDYAGQHVDTPSCDIYFAGTECKDVAHSNRFPKKLDLEHGEGRSSKTLKASLNYIARFQPAIVVLEDSYKKQVIEVMQREMRKLNIYDFEVFRLDPSSFKLKQTRRRAIACGVNLRKVLLRSPIHTWTEFLEKVPQTLQILDAITSNLIYPNDCRNTASLINLFYA